MENHPDDDFDREETIATAHDHLVATQQLPVDAKASRWIGEAEAVLGDLVDDTVDPGVLRERLSHVEMLLSNVEDTQNAAADEHVSAAERAVSSVLERLEQD